MAAVHDFTWSVKELEDMINCFDSDGDAKVSFLDSRSLFIFQFHSLFIR